MEIIKNIPFNKPYLTGNELIYIEEAVKKGHISGNGDFTKKCHDFFHKKYQFKKCLLTTSCTDALEMAALLIEVKNGDEIIVPSFTFVSSALAFTRQGAVIKFVDSHKSHPGMNEDEVEKLITKKTKAIVVVHYAGVACDMDKIMRIAEVYNLFVIEDAAQAVDSFYKGKPLGSIGNFGCFSFHETKNIQCGEGGMLVINDEKFFERSEILWEKGTNRSKFFRGEIDKYGWVDTGSSFLISDMLAAFLFAQLEAVDIIQSQRKKIWNAYYENLSVKKNITNIFLPFIPAYATNNAHMFYVICHSLSHRNNIIQRLKKHQTLAVFHYQSLHKSSYLANQNKSITLNNADKYTDTLLRLPFYFELPNMQIEKICEIINND